MNKILSWAVMAALLMGCNTQVNGQAADESSEQRKAKILENLQYQIPQIRDVYVVMGDFTDSGIDGLDQGSFTPAQTEALQSAAFVITTILPANRRHARPIDAKTPHDRALRRGDELTEHRRATQAEFSPSWPAA